MIVIPPPQSPRGKRAKNKPAPVVTVSFVSANYGFGGEYTGLTFSANLATPLPSASDFSITEDGNPATPIAVTLNAPNQLLLEQTPTHESPTVITILHPENIHFTNGGTLVAPFVRTAS